VKKTKSLECKCDQYNAMSPEEKKTEYIQCQCNRYNAMPPKKRPSFSSANAIDTMHLCLHEERWRTPAALHLAAAATSNFRGKRLGGRGQDNQASGINSLVLSTYLHHNSNHQFPIPLTLQLATASWWTWWLSEEGWVVVAQWACTAVDLASGQY